MDLDVPTEPAPPTTGFVPWPRARRGQRPMSGPVQAARTAFRACVADLPGSEVQPLMRRVERLGSIDELWHLRPELFRVVALCRSQGEAEQRLRTLDRHFF